MPRTKRMYTGGLVCHVLNRAGMLAVNSIKQLVNSGLQPALSPETVRRRQESRNTKSMRKSEKHYLDLIGAGHSPEFAQQTAGIIPLINTGQYLKSITYVLRSK